MFSNISIENQNIHFCFNQNPNEFCVHWLPKTLKCMGHVDMFAVLVLTEFSFVMAINTCISKEKLNIVG